VYANALADSAKLFSNRKVKAALLDKFILSQFKTSAHNQQRSFSAQKFASCYFGLKFTAKEKPKLVVPGGGNLSRQASKRQKMMEAIPSPLHEFLFLIVELFACITKPEIQSLSDGNFVDSACVLTNEQRRSSCTIKLPSTSLKKSTSQRTSSHNCKSFSCIRSSSPSKTPVRRKPVDSAF
jgi:hypothetical protein